MSHEFPVVLPGSRNGSHAADETAPVGEGEPHGAGAESAATAQWRAVEAALALDHAVSRAKPLVAKTEEALRRVDDALQEYLQALQRAERAKAKGPGHGSFSAAGEARDGAGESTG